MFFETIRIILPKDVCELAGLGSFVKYSSFLYAVKRVVEQVPGKEGGKV